MASHPLVLVSARAASVLGEYDHQIDFPEGDDFVIVYGPNGVGKTKFLEIVHAVSKIDGRTLLKMPFAEAHLRYSDGTEIHATFSAVPQSEGDPLRSRRIFFTLTSPDGVLSRWEHTGTDLEAWLLENTMWRPINQSLWEDRHDGEISSFAELEARYSEAVGASGDVPREFSAFRERVSSFLIETQRLRIEQNPPLRRPSMLRRRQSVKSGSKIADQATEMRNLVNEAQTAHSRITQQLDRTFPNRVLASDQVPIDDDAVRSRYNEQNEFRSRLGRVASVDLEDALSLPDRPLEDWERRLLSLYLDDADKKLEPFVLLLQKIELLEGIINSRLLRKRMQVTAAEGLKVVHRTADRQIDLDSLSSGEQHEIILMFDLLFNVPSGAVVLIDEPEISLHVVWQLAFIPDVRNIAELAGFRFVVATHSPQIVNDSWDQAVRLGPPEAEFS